MIRWLFREVYGTVRAFFRVWFHAHKWVELPFCYDLPNGTYHKDRVCAVPGCLRRERRKLVKGVRSGDATEIVEDVFSGWAPVKRGV